MTWFFDRGTESLALEVRRCEAGYDLCVQYVNGSSTVDNIANAADLLKRVQAVPSRLMEDGWRPRAAHAWWARESHTPVTAPATLASA